MRPLSTPPRKPVQPPTYCPGRHPCVHSNESLREVPPHLDMWSRCGGCAECRRAIAPSSTWG
eukprot:2387808-Prymnesium_polylepis.1